MNKLEKASLRRLDEIEEGMKLITVVDNPIVLNCAEMLLELRISPERDGFFAPLYSHLARTIFSIGSNAAEGLAKEGQSAINFLRIARASAIEAEAQFIMLDKVVPGEIPAILDALDTLLREYTTSQREDIMATLTKKG